MHTGLVVDKPSRHLLGVLLAELDDISTDQVPFVVDSILSPLLQASRRTRVSAANNRDANETIMSEAAASGFLITLELLPKVLGLTIGVTALGQGSPVPELVRGLSGAQYKERYERLGMLQFLPDPCRCFTVGFALIPALLSLVALPFQGRLAAVSCALAQRRGDRHVPGVKGSGPQRAAAAGGGEPGAAAFTQKGGSA